MKSNEKFCTHCGALLLDKNNLPAHELYDEELHRKSNILKLMSCLKCGQVADKYIECDGPLLLIDLALQFKEAYRHVLFNGGYASLIVRMALLTLICDGYIEWAQSAEAGEFFEQEYEFYLMCLKIFLGWYCTIGCGNFRTSRSVPKCLRAHFLSNHDMNLS